MLTCRPSSSRLYTPPKLLSDQSRLPPPCRPTPQTVHYLLPPPPHHGTTPSRPRQQMLRTPGGGWEIHHAKERLSSRRNGKPASRFRRQRSMGATTIILAERTYPIMRTCCRSRRARGIRRASAMTPSGLYGMRRSRRSKRDSKRNNPGSSDVLSMSPGLPETE